MQKIVVVLVDESEEVYKTATIDSMHELVELNDRAKEATDAILWWEVANASHINLAVLKQLPQTVELGVHSYEWTCLKCYTVNTEDFIPESVKCCHCQFTFNLKSNSRLVPA